MRSNLRKFYFVVTTPLLIIGYLLGLLFSPFIAGFWGAWRKTKSWLDEICEECEE